MVATTLHYLKIIYTSISKTERRGISSRRLGLNFIDFFRQIPHVFPGSTFLYIFSVLIEQGTETLPLRRQIFDGRELRRSTPYMEVPLLNLNVHHSQRFPKIITHVKCVMPLYDGYIACPKEGELYHRNPPLNRITNCGVSTLTNQKEKVLCYQVFDYSGMHNVDSTVVAKD